MNKLIKQIIFLIILASGLSFPQWSNDPNNNLIVGYGQDPHICSDSAGGCYITYNYETTWYPQKLAVERLDKYGYKPWGTLKQILGELPEQWQAEIIEDGEGGVIVSYQDNELNLPDFTTRVRVQRVDSNGNFLWGQTGVRVTADESNQGSQSLVGDGDGGCIVVWTQLLTDYTYDFRANRITNLGERAWSDTGIYLENRIDSDPAQIVKASDENFYVQIRRNLYRIRGNGEIVRRDSVTLGYPIPDHEGGVVLSGKTGTVNNVKLVAQRKDSLGNNLWQEPYVEVADSLFINSRLSIRYNNNYYFGWTSNKNGIETQPHMQGLRDDGTELFMNGGIPLSNSSTTITSFIPIIPSDHISNIYIWTQWINQPSSTGNFAKRIDTTSTQVWGDSAVLLNTPALRYLGVTTDCSGGAIGTGYLNEDFAIRVFKVSSKGILGEIITSIDEGNTEINPSNIILYQNYPNPFNSFTVIRYFIPSEDQVTIGLYNVIGELIKTIVESYHSKGIHTVSLSYKDLPSGIYLYKLKTGTQSLTKKLIIIK